MVGRNCQRQPLHPTRGECVRVRRRQRPRRPVPRGLAQAHLRGWDHPALQQPGFSGETGWASSGGGCSRYEPAPSAQRAFTQYANVTCAGKRATPDVALDADPASGVAVYDSTPYQTQTGWFDLGGTSASTPMWAARAATAEITIDAAAIYSTTLTYRDIATGNNGAPCLVGYDLVTGRGPWTGPTP